MAETFEGRPAKKQAIDTGIGDGSRDAKPAAIAVAAAAGPAVCPPKLEDLAEYIVEFLKPEEAAVVAPSFLQAVERKSELALARVEQTLPVSAADWRLRLSRQVLACYQRFYFGGTETNDRPPQRPRLHPTLHPRLLWQCANTCPLTKLGKLHGWHYGRLVRSSESVVPLNPEIYIVFYSAVTPHIGPSVMLPNGNMAVACTDTVIRILDTKHMTWADAGGLDPQVFQYPDRDRVVAHVAGEMLRRSTSGDARRDSSSNRLYTSYFWPIRLDLGSPVLFRGPFGFPSKCHVQPTR